MRGLTLLTWIGMAFWGAIQVPPSAFAEEGPGTISSPIIAGMSDDELDAQRGGEIVPVSEATLTAILEENTISGSSITGNNSVGGSAFAGANGFMTVIQNSGNQVIIQDSTIINLTVE